MKEIKFRAWDNEDYMSSPFTLEDLQNKKIEFTDDCEVMQYTGLRDKNGKEIYEGDICRVNHNDIRYAITEDNIVEWNKNECAWEFGCGTASEINWSHEIIGNIYENPEILDDN